METSPSETYQDTCDLGFSLLELIAVIAVIASLAAVSFGVLDGVRSRKVHARTQSELAMIRGALESYRLDFGQYPIVNNGSAELRSKELLVALSGLQDPDGNPLVSDKRYIESQHLALDDSLEYLVDGWGRALFYGFSEAWQHGQYFLISSGPDGLADFPGADGVYHPEVEVNKDNVEGIDL